MREMNEEMMAPFSLKMNYKVSLFSKAKLWSRTIEISSEYLSVISQTVIKF